MGGVSYHAGHSIGDKCGVVEAGREVAARLGPSGKVEDLTCGWPIDRGSSPRTAIPVTEKQLIARLAEGELNSRLTRSQGHGDDARRPRDPRRATVAGDVSEHSDRTGAQ